MTQEAEPPADPHDSTGEETGTALFECDQCTWRERRPVDQEPWPCPVCGWVRWSLVRE